MAGRPTMWPLIMSLAVASAAADDSLRFTDRKEAKTSSHTLDTLPRLARRILEPPGLESLGAEHRSSPDGALVLLENNGDRRASLIQEDGNIQYASLNNKGSNTYEFGYDTRGGRTGARFFRHEEKGADGRVRGQYGFVDANDDLHVVVYITDALGHRIRTETHKLEGYGRELSKILEEGASSAQVKDRINTVIQEQASSSPPPRVRTASPTFTMVSPTFRTTPRPLTNTQKVRRTTLSTRVPTGPEPYFLDDDTEPPVTSPRPSTSLRPSASRHRSKTLSRSKPRSHILNQVTPSPAFPKNSHSAQGLTPPPPVFPLGFDDSGQQFPATLPPPHDSRQVSPPATITTRPPSTHPGSDMGVFQTTDGPATDDGKFPPPPKFPTMAYSTKTTSMDHITTSAPGYTPPTRASTSHTYSSAGYVSGSGQDNIPSTVTQTPHARPAASNPTTPPLPLSLTIPVRHSLSGKEYQELRDYLRRILSSDRSPSGGTVLLGLGVSDVGTSVNGVVLGSLGTMSEIEGDNLAVFLDRKVIDGGIIDGGIIDGGIIDGGIIDGGIIGDTGIFTGENLDTLDSDTGDGRIVNDGGGPYNGVACDGMVTAALGCENLHADIIDGGIIDGGIINSEALGGRELDNSASMGTRPNGFQDSDIINGYRDDGHITSESAALQQQRSRETHAADDSRRKVFTTSQYGSQGPTTTITAPPVSLIHQLIAFHKPGFPKDLDQPNPSTSPAGGADTPGALHYIPSPDLSTDGPDKGHSSTSSFPQTVILGKPQPQNDNKAGRDTRDHSSQGNYVPDSSGNTFVTSSHVTVAVVPEQQEKRPEDDGGEGGRRSRLPSINLVRPIMMNQDSHSSLQLQPRTKSSPSPSRSPVSRNMTLYVTTTSLIKTPHLPDHHPQPDQPHTRLTHHILPIHLSLNHLAVPTSPPSQSTSAKAGREGTTAVPLASHTPSGSHTSAAATLQPPPAFPPPPTTLLPPRVSTLPPSTFSTLPPSHTSTLPPPQISTLSQSQGPSSFRTHVTTSLLPHLTPPSPPQGSTLNPSHGLTPHHQDVTTGRQQSPPRPSLPNTPPPSPPLHGSPQAPSRGDDLSRAQSSVHSFPPPTLRTAPPHGLPEGVRAEDIVPILHQGPSLIPTTQRSILYPGRVPYEQLTFHNHYTRRGAGRDVASAEGPFRSGRSGR